VGPGLENGVIIFYGCPRLCETTQFKKYLFGEKNISNNSNEQHKFIPEWSFSISAVLSHPYDCRRRKWHNIQTENYTEHKTRLNYYQIVQGNNGKI